MNSRRAEAVARIQALLRQGLTYREVAKEVGCSVETVGRNRPEGLAKVRRARPPTEFPVHPEVEAAKRELLAAFDNLGDLGRARAKLSAALRKYHPRESRHQSQFEHVKIGETMIQRDAEPTHNVTPYKRIAIGSEAPTRPAPCALKTEEDAVEPHVSVSEAERIWNFVVQTSRGTNAPTPAAESFDLISFAKTGAPPQDCA